MVRFGHVLSAVDDTFVVHGGYGQECIYEAQGSGDPDLSDVFEEESYNYFCMPDLNVWASSDVGVVPNVKQSMVGTAKFYSDVTGDPVTDPSLYGAGATRKTLWANFYGDTWLFNHTHCPEDCNGNGRCNLGFCVCDHDLGPDYQNHTAVQQTSWISEIMGTDTGHWGYHCR